MIVPITKTKKFNSNRDDQNSTLKLINESKPGESEDNGHTGPCVYEWGGSAWKMVKDKVGLSTLYGVNNQLLVQYTNKRIYHWKGIWNLIIMIFSKPVY